jgi:hydroxymethylpyrimidine/phosphomethylpyrimidine kinase
LIPRVLTVAASDSSGAAGLQADLKTFEARQVFGLSAVTAITAQDSRHIEVVQVLDPALVAQQIAVVLDDIRVDTIKTGLLFHSEIIDAVLEAITSARSAPDRLVIDPVLVSGDGRSLVDDTTIEAYVTGLFPRALIITPNIDEAAILTGLQIDDPDAMAEAARMLHDMGPAFVLVKGGHLAWGDKILDLLYDGSTFQEFRSVRLPGRNVRGAGCTFASCIAAEVAKGRDVPAAVSIAKQYLTTALTAAAGWKVGRGRGTIFHSTGRPPLYNEPEAEAEK